VVLGGGRVGSAIAIDLARDVDVTVVDASATNLERLARPGGPATINAALDEPAQLKRAVAPFDLVVGALPGHMGFAALAAIIEAGKPVVDISFFAEDPFDLDTAAREAGVPAVIDCGVAPGLSNLILGRETTRMDRVERFECLVGGLPEHRELPWEYKAPFSPSDVIEEYTRPARVKRNGRDVILEALSELESIDFEEVGELEAFVTDGLRTLLRTVDVPNMVEKTLRYPGHAAKIQALRDAGLLDREPVKLGETQIRPIELTSMLLESRWRFQPGERDLTVMRVTVDGLTNSQPVTREYRLLDRFDAASDTASMSRTTGYTCAAVARLMIRGDISEKGIIAPEVIGQRPGQYDAIIQDLEARGVRLVVQEHRAKGGKLR